MFPSGIFQLEQCKGDYVICDLSKAWPYWVKYTVLVIKNKTELVNIQAKLRVLENIAKYPDYILAHRLAG